MKRKNITAVCVLLLSGILWQGCSGKTDASAEGASAVPTAEAEAEAEEAPADTEQESEPETAEAETDKAEETQDAQAELPDGVYTARRVSVSTVSSYLAFSSLPQMRRLFAVALSLKSPSPSVRRHPCREERGLSS